MYNYKWLSVFTNHRKYSEAIADHLLRQGSLPGKHRQSERSSLSPAENQHVMLWRIWKDNIG